MDKQNSLVMNHNQLPNERLPVVENLDTESDVIEADENIAESAQKSKPKNPRIGYYWSALASLTIGISNYFFYYLGGRISDEEKKKTEPVKGVPGIEAYWLYWFGSLIPTLLYHLVRYCRFKCKGFKGSYFTKANSMYYELAGSKDLVPKESMMMD